MQQVYDVGDRILTGAFAGEIIEVLTPRELPNFDSPMPRYLVRLDNGTTLKLYQNALTPAGD